MRIAVWCQMQHLHTTAIYDKCTAVQPAFFSLVVRAAEQGEHRLGNAGGGFLVAAEEVGDTLAVIGGYFGETEVGIWIERVGFAARADGG